MKAIKMFGLAALTALMAMAFLGVSSAMAERTALCGTDAKLCEAVTHVHETSVTKAKLLTSFGTTECDVLALGDVKSAGNPLVLEVNLTYSNCKLGSTNCTLTEENGPGELKVLKEGHETSKVTGEYLVKFVCGESLNCAYNGVSLVWTGKGPLLSTQANGEVTTTEKVLNKEAGGFLCPKESKLDVTLTPLSPTYINGGLHYCVEYTGANTGLYLKSTCTEKHSTRLGKFQLVVGPAGFAKGEKVCVDLSEKVGLYEEAVVGGGVCQKDNEANTSLYEQGTITEVQ